MISHSVVLTVHNKEKLIKKVLKSILKNTSSPFELVMVFDGCNDKSEEIAEKLLKRNIYKNINKKILYADDVFETKANNIGLKECTGDFISIIQDDMVIKEKDWNLNLFKPFTKYNDVFSVTAHTSHNVGYVPPTEDQKEGEYYMLNFPDSVGFRTFNSYIPRDKFHIRLTSNRGPLMINHDYLEKLGYLDEIYSPQTWDEHDLTVRANLKYGLVSGFYPIDWFSKLSWGSTRDESGGLKPWHRLHEYKNQKIFYERYKEVIKSRIVEERNI